MPAGCIDGRWQKSHVEEVMAALKVGEAAPDFELVAVSGKQRQKIKLSEFRGNKNVVLAFYPLDWSPT